MTNPSACIASHIIHNYKEKMKAINDFLLGLFTGNDESRPVLMFPNLKDGIVCASDGHVLISIPEDELTIKYNSVEKYPNGNKIISDMESETLRSIKIDIETLAKELTKCRFEADKLILKCKECDGTGNVEWEYEDKERNDHYKTDDCPLCDGTGKDEQNNPFPKIIVSTFDKEENVIQISIGDLLFHPYQIYRLFMVAVSKGYKEIEMFYNPHQYGQTLTYFGNVKVLVMAMLKSNK